MSRFSFACATFVLSVPFRWKSWFGNPKIPLKNTKPCHEVSEVNCGKLHQIAAAKFFASQEMSGATEADFETFKVHNTSFLFKTLKTIPAEFGFWSGPFFAGLLDRDAQAGGSERSGLKERR
jgi:hypothetical protein